MLPKKTVSVFLDADNPGQWMMHCHNAYHGQAGRRRTWPTRPDVLRATSCPAPSAHRSRCCPFLGTAEGRFTARPAGSRTPTRPTPAGGRHGQGKVAQVISTPGGANLVIQNNPAPKGKARLLPDPGEAADKPGAVFTGGSDLVNPTASTSRTRPTPSSRNSPATPGRRSSPSP